MFQEASEAKDKWHLERWSKFTASECYKLLGNNKQGEIFGDAAWTYIKQKALEMASAMWERPELEEAKSLLHGKMYEFPAFNRYVKETKNYTMQHFGTDAPLFLAYEKMPNESGGSPDAANINSSFKIDVGVEIKCPKNPMYHFDRLKWKDQWDIKQNYIQAYAQIQHLLLITEADYWHFVSYDERMNVDAKKINIIEVKPDKKFQDNLHLRLIKAVEEKYKEYEKHINS